MKLLPRLRKQPPSDAWRLVTPRIANRGPYEPVAVVEPVDDPLQRLLQFGRYGVIAAEQSEWMGEQSEVVLEARRQLEIRFRTVPDGYAAIPQTIRDDPGAPEIDYEVAAFRLAEHPVTNAEFQWFVDAGGYNQLELWPRDLWDQLPELVDLTGKPAPRYWQDARHDRRLADHPVVGVSYFEAAAYAHWAGYRLPAEEEWQMAATWRLRSQAHSPRRYPWGDSLDVQRCNVWASGIGDTVEVSAYADGSAPNDVRQLIGNVWEWTASDFLSDDKEGRPIVGDMPMKSIRGGAFDTYFPYQCAGTFRTGMVTLARTRNVGFRCAMLAETDMPAESMS